MGMPTNLNLDDDLVEQAFRLSGKKTKREAVNEALQEYVQSRMQKNILEVFGTADYDPDYDYKRERRGDQDFNHIATVARLKML